MTDLLADIRRAEALKAQRMSRPEKEKYLGRVSQPEERRQQYGLPAPQLGAIDARRSPS